MPVTLHNALYSMTENWVLGGMLFFVMNYVFDDFQVFTLCMML